MDDLPDIRFINAHPKRHSGHHTLQKKHEEPAQLGTENTLCLA